MYVIHLKDRSLDIPNIHHLTETFLCTSIVIWVVQFRVMILFVCGPTISFAVLQEAAKLTAPCRSEDINLS